MRQLQVGVIGCGNISSAYFQAVKRFPILNIHACADLDLERAQAKAAEYNIPHAYTVEELLPDPEIELVINLTIPQAHAEVCLQILSAGKHVYVEKPFAINRADAKRVIDLALEKGLLVGSAPDTFLGGGIQTSLKLIEDGWIGKPFAFAAFMMNSGHESWHPDPGFYYQLGGGPLFDMGPYYLTALVNLLGPVRSVSASAQITYPQRTITSKPKFGQQIQVETPTHISSLLNFESGVTGTFVTSFDIQTNHDFPHIEIYGTEGTLRVPDPNTFDGPVLLKRKGSNEWTKMPLSHGFTEQGRGMGVVDMAYALQSGRLHRANGQLAYHVLDVMQSILESADEGVHKPISSRCARSKPLPMGLPGNALDQ